MRAFLTILYNPCQNYRRNITMALAFGFEPFVYLNSVSAEEIEYLNNLGVTVFGDNTNAGLGSAFFEMESYFASAGYVSYVYFDQDTYTTEATWTILSREADLLMSNSDLGSVFVTEAKLENPLAVISSGSLFPVSVFNTIGPHDPSYFVEGVDYEFCLRLRINGLSIKIVVDKSMDHSSLQDSKVVKLWRLSIPYRVYGDSRLTDFNHAHKRLLRQAFLNNEWKFLIFLLKSLVVFNLGERFSRIVASSK